MDLPELSYDVRKNNLKESRFQGNSTRLIKLKMKPMPKYMITSKINQDLVPIAAPTDMR